jgi:hypothetical protein
LVHEGGHLLPAVLSGAVVNRFVWTPLLGELHVSLSGVSGAAQPWVDAGGILLPTAIGTLLVAIWMSLPDKRPTPLWRFWLLIPGGVLLIGNVGLFWEAASCNDAYHHMAGLAHVVGDGGSGLLFQVAPALWSCLMIGWAILRWRRLRTSLEVVASAAA